MDISWRALVCAYPVNMHEIPGLLRGVQQRSSSSLEPSQVPETLLFMMGCGIDLIYVQSAEYTNES